MPHARTILGTELTLCALQDGSLSSLGVHPSGTKQRGWSHHILGVLAVHLHPWRAAILGGGSPIALGVGRRGAGRWRALCQPRLSNPLLNHLQV